MPETLLFKIHSLTYSLDSIATVMLKQRFNISFNQFVILLGVLNFKQTNQKQLELFSLLSNAAVSKIVSQLQIKQLVRKSNLTNMRDNSIALTDTGLLLINKAVAEVEKISQKYFPAANSDEYALLLKSISNILLKVNL